MPLCLQLFQGGNGKRNLFPYLRVPVFHNRSVKIYGYNHIVCSILQELYIFEVDFYRSNKPIGQFYKNAFGLRTSRGKQHTFITIQVSTYDVYFTSVHDRCQFVGQVIRWLIGASYGMNKPLHVVVWNGHGATITFPFLITVLQSRDSLHDGIQMFLGVMYKK